MLAIVGPAVAQGRFVGPFKRDRMTWIMPSLLWKAYRSGWASKPGQERILAIEITRAGFEWALAHSCLSHFDPAVHDSRERWKAQLAESPVRIQWDPERSLDLEPLPHRAIQIGIGGESVNRYVDDGPSRSPTSPSTLNTSTRSLAPKAMVGQLSPFRTSCRTQSRPDRRTHRRDGIADRSGNGEAQRQHRTPSVAGQAGPGRRSNASVWLGLTMRKSRSSRVAMMVWSRRSAIATIDASAASRLMLL